MQYALIPVLAAAGMLVAAPSWPAATEWELKVDDHAANIKIYSRVNERGFLEFKGISTYRSRLSAFVALLRDVENMPKWVYRTERVETLRMVSDAEAYAHTVNSLPAPLSDRDSVVRSTLVQDRQTLAITIRGTGVPHYLPVDERYVRMPVVESSWTFTPLDGGLVEVAFQGYGDPGGNLSTGLFAWFVRLSILDAPYNTLLNMRDMLARKEYQSASYSFITEPAR